MVHFSNTERKELSTQNATPNENIFQELRGNQDILRWKKAKRICHQPTHPKKKKEKKMAEENFLNRKETIKERTLKYQEKWKNTGKNMSKNDKLSSSLCLMIQAKITTL